MKKMIKRMCLIITITIVLASTTINTFAKENAKVETIIVGNETLYVLSTAYPYAFIVIWEDPEGLDILTYPWTGYNNGLRSDVVYRLALGDRFLVDGVVRNNRGNVFLRLVDGNFVYSGDVAFDFDENGQRMDDYLSNNMGEFYSTFKKMNETGGVMDVKTLDPSSKKIPYKAYYGLENRLTTKTAEELGNELYGYVGSKIGLHKYVLWYADLFNNLLKDIKEGKEFSWDNYVHSYNDAPEDADCIDEGIDYYHRTH